MLETSLSSLVNNDEAGPEVKTKPLRRARATVVESSESKLENRHQVKLALPAPRAIPTKKRTRS